MLRFVIRQLMFEPLRTALTVTALAAVVAVILVLEGFNEGLVVQLGNVVRERQAELIVTQAGVSNMTAARSLLPQFARAEVEAVPGVAAAHPLTGLPVIYVQGDRRTPIFLLVYDSAGGPRRLVAGAAAAQARDIVIDRSLARTYGLEPGDPFVVSDFSFRVSGITEGAAAMFTPYAFARYDDLIDFYLESDVAADISTFPLLSFLLVELAPGASPRMVAKAVEAAVPEGDVFLPEVLASADEALGRALFGPILRFLIDVAYGIGVLVAGIIVFATVNSRRREFGVLKALGFGNGFLARAVVLEAALLALGAIPIGMALAGVVAAVIELSMPLYLILVVEPIPLIRTSVACVVLAVLGALFPVRMIRGVEPALVFRS